MANIDFNNLTLSDFYNMEIGVREDGSVTPIIDIWKGKWVGLVGFKGNPEDSDLEIKEDAFMYYQEFMERLNKQLKK